MKKLAVLAIVLLTTSCAVNEEPIENSPITSTEQSESSTEETTPADDPDLETNVQNDNQTQSDSSGEISGGENGTDPTDSTGQQSREPPNQAEPADADQLAGETVNSYINLLRVAPEVTSGYDRDLFRHWVDANGNGCHAREETLIAESVGPVSVTGECDISGSWFSAFDGETTTNPSNFDVDHLVPLKEAWDSGANSWDRATKERYANDLGSPHSLIAVSRGSNRSKGAKDPAEWMPPRGSYHCEYIFTWTMVKIRWSLSADQAEINALRNIGGDCLVSEMNFLPTVSEADIVTGFVPEPEPEPEPTPVPSEEQALLDPRFRTCGLAKENGYGPYVLGVDPEYEWYRDGDGDGTVCE